MAINSQIGQRLVKLLTIRKEQDIETQISEAEKIVHSIEHVDSQKAFKYIQHRIQRQIGRKRILNTLTRVAAIFTVPLLVVSLIFYYQTRNQHLTEQFALQQISNPSGVRSEIVLPDGSKVWLNAESTLKYKIPFNNINRSVELTGEAFFEVKKDKNLPFQVKLGNINVTVLGTRFNCKSFPENTNIEVVLEEGKVSLNSSNGSKTGKAVILNPKEMAVFNKKTNQINISEENIEKYIGWHKGKLVFEECPLPEVARRLERWFGIEVEIVDQELFENRISTTFENESLHQILNLLEMASPIKANRIPASFGKTTHTKEKVIITSKN